MIKIGILKVKGIVVLCFFFFFYVCSLLGWFFCLLFGCVVLGMKWMR